MATNEQLHQDLDYVARAVRHQDQPVGVPAIYFLWAAIILVGFALPDLAPRMAGRFWLVAAIGGGLLSWWLGARDALASGVSDPALGKRHGYHWLITGVAFALSALPLVTGRGDQGAAISNFLLITGLAYALAGIHLVRPMLASGLVMLAAYGVLQLFAPPYTWTITGVAIAVALTWAGVSARRARRAGALQ
jgi:hypothetical protein